MTELYGPRWAQHPDNEQLQSWYEFLLASLAESGDLQKESIYYSLKSRALNTLDAYEQEQAKHQAEIRIQSVLASLTAALVFVGFIQVIDKFPTVSVFIRLCQPRYAACARSADRSRRNVGWVRPRIGASGRLDEGESEAPNERAAVTQQPKMRSRTQSCWVTPQGDFQVVARGIGVGISVLKFTNRANPTYTCFATPTAVIPAFIAGTHRSTIAGTCG